jgi:glucose/arabinose dehydrogenase
MKSIAAFIFFAIFIGMFFLFINFRGVASPAFIHSSNTPAVAHNNTNFPLTIPPDFTISIFAKNLGGARVLEFDPTGILIVSIPSRGLVMSLPDGGVVADHLTNPHGIAFHCDTVCKLYVAETDKVSIFDYNNTTHKAFNKQKILDLPIGGQHVTRSLLIKDNKLLISIGSSCNVCHETDERRAAIMVSDLDGKNAHIFARGLRNTVFMAINPFTNQVWGNDMGRDLLGDDIPPDEINILEEGKDYGWPVCWGKNNADTKFESSANCNGKNASYIDYQAHSAPLGLAFIKNDLWPKEYQGNLLVAFHGSWNRTTPTGYKIVMVSLDKNGNLLDISDFITGWLNGSQTLGRPVGIVFDKAGNAFISDDKAGVVYKLSYTKS